MCYSLEAGHCRPLLWVQGMQLQGGAGCKYCSSEMASPAEQHRPQAGILPQSEQPLLEELCIRSFKVWTEQCLPNCKSLVCMPSTW